MRNEEISREAQSLGRRYIHPDWNNPECPRPERWALTAMASRIFTHTAASKIRRNPFEAIALAALAIDDREAVRDYVYSLPIPTDLQWHIIQILDVDIFRRK